MPSERVQRQIDRLLDQAEEVAFASNDSFTFAVSDGSAESLPTALLITVIAANKQPVENPPTAPRIRRSP